MYGRVETSVGDSELPAAEECAECEATGSIEVLVWEDIGVEEHNDSEENRKRDGQFGVPVAFAMVTLDPANKTLDERRFCGGKGEVAVDVKGAQVDEVCFDGLGLNSTPEGSDPCHDGRGGCG